mgnify:CR=1 FL=1
MRDGMTRWERRRNAEEKVNSMADGFVASNNLLEDARYSWKKNPQLRTLIRRALAIAGERRGMSPGQISQMLDQLEPPPTRFAAPAEETVSAASVATTYGADGGGKHGKSRRPRRDGDV